VSDSKPIVIEQLAAGVRVRLLSGRHQGKTGVVTGEVLAGQVIVAIENSMYPLLRLGVDRPTEVEVLDATMPLDDAQRAINEAMSTRSKASSSKSRRTRTQKETAAPPTMTPEERGVVDVSWGDMRATVVVPAEQVDSLGSEDTRDRLAQEFASRLFDDLALSYARSCYLKIPEAERPGILAGVPEDVVFSRVAEAWKGNVAKTKAKREMLLKLFALQLSSAFNQLAEMRRTRRCT
jgi:hypothetical protein